MPGDPISLEIGILVAVEYIRIQPWFKLVYVSAMFELKVI